MSSTPPHPPPPPPPRSAHETFAAPPPSAGVDVELSERNHHHHPLAVNPPPPPPPQPTVVAPPPFPATTPAALSTTTTPALSAQTSIVSSTLSSSSSLAKTLDDLADEFLQRGQEGGLRLRPASAAGPPAATYAEPIPANLSDMERLRLMEGRRHYGDVLRLCQELLRGQGSPYHSLYVSLQLHADTGSGADDEQHLQKDLVRIMISFCKAAVRLKQYEELSKEVATWIFCHHQSGNSPSWIPWSLHITAASCLQFTASKHPAEQEEAAMKAADALTAIRNTLEELADSETKTAALLQVDQALASVYSAHQKWKWVLDSIERQRPLLVSACHYECKGDAAKARVLESAYQTELLSRQGRVLLQAGCLPEAAAICKQAAAAWRPHESGTTALPHHHAAVSRAPATLSVNEGLLCFAHGKHEEALEFFRKAVGHLQKAAAAVNAQEALAVPLDSLETSYAEAINNMALAAVYTCRLQEAVMLQEGLVREDVSGHLTERVALNLCTLYELGSDTADSSRRKRVLQQIANRFGLVDVGAECFRVG